MGEVIADRYEILEMIGRGGMGTVYKARQRTLNRTVAVKMLSQELASDIEFRARFRQEASVLAQMNHPGIVQIYDIETHDDTFCIIMEYVEGETLQSLVSRQGAIPEHKVLQLGAQVARGLAFAHRLGVVHRDVKPDNILLGSTGMARIMDFGIAYVKGSTLKTQTGISMGTPRYMSPEQVTGRGVDGQADLYCLGLCMYFGLTGQPPFDGDNPVEIATKQVYEQPPLPSSIYTAISPGVDDFIMRSIAKAPEDRWPDGDAMADFLESMLRQREHMGRGAGVEGPFGRSISVTGPTPARVVLGHEESDEGVPKGETHKVPQLQIEKKSGVESGTGSVKLGTETPVPGLIPLAPLPETVADFPGPQKFIGVTPTHGVPRSSDPSDSAQNREPIALEGDGLPQGELDKSHRSGPWPLTLVRKNPILGIIVSAGLVLLGMVSWPSILRFIGPPQSPTLSSRLAIRDESLETIERDTMENLGQGRFLEKLRRWQDFRETRYAENSRDPAVAVADGYIRWLRSRIPPLEATDDLVRRRLDRAQTLLSDRRPAIAAVYTETTVDLFGRSSSYNERVENLRRLIERNPNPGDPNLVPDLLKRALELTSSDADVVGPLLTADELQAENFLLDAVQADPSSFETWMAGGQFYQARGYYDDARVFFTAALDRAETGAQRGQATQRLESLPTR
jgi:tRNA A-37 threonylcarbamoyl transferase component Bud32